MQHQIHCRLFGMGGAIELAVENGARDGYGRSVELLGAYLHARAGGGGKDGGKGGGKGGEAPCRAAVLVEATPDAAASVRLLMRDLQP